MPDGTLGRLRKRLGTRWQNPPEVPDAPPAGRHVGLRARIARQIVGESNVAYTARAMSQNRIEKTIGKLRAGELPAPTVLRRFMTGGLGGACSGCGEKIGRFEHSYFIRVGEGDTLRFHVVCHETWARFKR